MKEDEFKPLFKLGSFFHARKWFQSWSDLARDQSPLEIVLLYTSFLFLILFKLKDLIRSPIHNLSKHHDTANQH